MSLEREAKVTIRRGRSHYKEGLMSQERGANVTSRKRGQSHYKEGLMSQERGVML